MQRSCTAVVPTVDGTSHLKQQRRGCDMVELGSEVKGIVTGIISSRGDVLDLGERVNVTVFGSRERRERRRKELARTASWFFRHFRPDPAQFVDSDRTLW